MMEVDPKLFITCRLCLEDMGQYQIVPKVQEQIKFCFNIEVQPFDGLPQLICKKCEEILSRFYEAKTVYIKKQEDLKGQSKLKREISVPQQETIHTLQQNGSDKKSIVYGKSKQRKRISRISSTTSESASESNNIDLDLWAHSYMKQFACRFCKYISSHQSDILTHVHTRHKKLKEKFRNILKRHCLVQLPKLDSKPNITGSSSTVVFGNKKIIKNVNMDYSIIYSIKEDNSYVCENSDSGDDDMVVKKKRRRCRLFSKSSNETVVFDPNENEELFEFKTDKKCQEMKANKEVENVVFECIKIDDSTDSDSGKENVSLPKNLQMKLRLKDQEAIQSIISICKNNLHKNIDHSSAQTKPKEECQSTNIESKLKHKLLSIGRKIVNKQGFNCTGLLRYMEHKNLEIIWIPKSTVNSTVNSDYIRIMTKLKDNMEENKTSWKLLPINKVVENNKFFFTSTSSSGFTSTLSSAVITKLPIETNSEITLNGNASHNDTSYLSNHCKNILLNKSPVANPKQLPKKANVIESKSNIHYEKLAMAQNQSDNELIVTVDPVGDNILMPIITETTSLALVQQHDSSYNIETADANVTKANTDKSFGRIKVKPVSELMPEGVVNNIKEQTSASISQAPNTDRFQYHGAMIANNLLPIQMSKVPNTTNKNVPTSSSRQILNSGYVILDTVELPNTRTDAPFNYLQTLLQIHNMILLDTKEKLGSNFICLIKFKVKYKEEYKDRPVILCLSLFCYKNTFCIKVNDRNLENINMKKISANWQWEIIKIFTGETVKKLLENAEKISKEVYDYTKSFCCLLTSINFRKVCENS